MNRSVLPAPAAPRLALWQWIVLFVASAAATYVILLLAIPIRSTGRAVAKSSEAGGEKKRGGSKTSSAKATPDKGKSTAKSSSGNSTSDPSTTKQPSTSTDRNPTSNDDTPEPAPKTGDRTVTPDDINPASAANPIPDEIPAPPNGAPGGDRPPDDPTSDAPPTDDPAPIDTAPKNPPDRPAVAREPLSPLKNVEEVQQLVNERVKAGEFGKPTDWKKAAEFANAEVQRRHEDGRLSQTTQIQFQGLNGGISVSVSTRSGG
jgi:hypothetical protein